MDKHDMQLLFSTCKIRNIALELTNASLAAYLVKEQKYIPCICGTNDESRVGIKLIHDILGIEAKLVLSSHYNDNLFEHIPVIQVPNTYCKANLCLFCFSKTAQDSEIISLTHPKVLVDLSQAMKENIKTSFYNYFFDHMDDFVRTIELFSDELSRTTYYEYIKSFITGDNYEGPSFEEKNKYFDLLKNYQRITNIRSSWINVGNCKGDTIFWALLSGYQFSRIFAIEESPANILSLIQNISLIKQETLNKIVVIEGKCGVGSECISIDSLNLDEPIILINMDIEGSEIEALISAKKTINTYKPILAVCAYHRPDDLLTIPRTILNICSEYSFILRKYSSGTGKHYNGVHRTNELVLYAIPNSWRKKYE